MKIKNFYLYYKYPFYGVILWTFILVCSYIYHYIEFNNSIVKLAEKEAKILVNKDLCFRLWANSHGGVYVPVTLNTQPDGNLKNVSERDIVSPSGKKFTLISPSSIMNEIFKNHSELYGEKIKITALDVINPKNTPDEWEIKALNILKMNTDIFFEIVDLKGGNYLRFMRSIKVNKNCIKCHKNNINSKTKNWGGIGVSTNMEPYYNMLKIQTYYDLFFHFIIWLFGLIASFFLMNVRKKQLKIYEQKIINENLEESNIYLHNIINSLTHPFYVIDTKTYEIVMANNAVNFSSENNNNKCYKLTHFQDTPCESDDHICPLKEVLKTKKPFSVEHNHYDINKNLRIFLVNCFPIIDDDGNVSKVIEYSIDITEQKKNEKYWELIFNSVSDLIYFVDLDYNIIKYNKALSQKLKTNISITENPYYKIFHGLDKPNSKCFHKKIIDNNVEQSCEIEFEELEGIYQVNAYPVFDLNDEMIGAVHFAKDITNQRILEKQLKEVLDINENIITQSPVGISVYDKDGFCIQANNAMLNIIGAEDIQYLLKVNYNKVESWKKSGFLEKAKQALNDNKIIRTDFINLTHFGKKVFLDCHLIPLDNGKLLKMAVDISDRIKYEKELKNARKEADQANRAKSSFLANMSHEIRTPMNAIIGFSDILKEQYIGPLNDKQMEYMDVIIDSTEKLLKIINDILDISKIEAGKVPIKYEDFNVRSMMYRMSQIASGLIKEKNIEIKITTNENIPEIIKGDDLRIEQVLKNLVSNAVKFTEMGLIEISASLSAENEILFSVKDTGIGIEDDKEDDLFEKFYQVDNSYSKKYAGTGLGLAISKELIRLMGGDIWFESELGKGSIFYFTIPFKLSNETNYKIKTDNNADSNITKTISKNILIADDDPLNIEFISFYLKQNDCNIFAAENGIQVLDILLKHEIDLILMDIQMPELNGFETIKIIRKSQSDKYSADIPIIAITAYAMNGDKEKIMDSGVNDYVSKPINMKILMEKINAILM